MFTGLDKGQIDCAVMGANELKTRSLWDVAKHINMANLGPYFAGWLWAMNGNRSEVHTSELQSLMRISYAVFCLKKNKTTYQQHYLLSHSIYLLMSDKTPTKQTYTI